MTLSDAFAATRSDPAVAALSDAEKVAEILRLKAERGAVILAHNYQIPAIQDLADLSGDSLALSRSAASAEEDLIVFCGVHFMAETAAILAPDKRVLLPDLRAGCSLADTITAEQLRSWKAEHPDATVIAYVNTSAEVKAESDYCCTSSNALAVVQAAPADRPILFLPDMFLGAYVKRMTDRTDIHLWMGECHVHAGLRPEDVARERARHPGAEFLVHPECGCVSATLFDLAEGRIDPTGTHVLSTGGMLARARESPASEFVVATETGILHRLRTDNPTKTFHPVNRKAFCEFMKMITLDNLLISLRDEVHHITVPPEVADRARLAIERMVSIG